MNFLHNNPASYHQIDNNQKSVVNSRSLQNGFKSNIRCDRS